MITHWKRGESGRITASMTEFVQWQTGMHTCDCGAKYKVTVTEAVTKDATCEKCGALMDSRVSESFLTYERMPRDK
jgi:transcription initiation factor IIE alpha subunit